MYKLLAITVVGALALARADDEQFWLNEIEYVSSTGVNVEVVFRPNKDDLEGAVVANLAAQFYSGDKDGVSTAVHGETDIGTRVPKTDDDDEEKWNGNWFGFSRFLTHGAAFSSDADFVGALKLTSPFGDKAERRYCWGQGATTAVQVDSKACDVVVGTDFPLNAGQDGLLAQTRAYVDKSGTPEDGGVKEADFEIKVYEDDSKVPLSSMGLPNNCTKDSTCTTVTYEQTFGEYSFASSINSLAMMMGAGVAALFGIAAA